MIRKLAVMSFAALALSVGAAHAEGDVEKGAKVFKKCKACHDAENEKNKVGPHLVGIVGRAAGAVGDFKYSDAMTGSGLTWDAATLDQYLADPKGFVPGNRMAFAGLKKEDDRVNVIAYLQSLQ